MKHEKTFSAISKLKEVELELHRLKNALEMANKALEAKHQKVVFPTMLRKMWSGGEVQAWLDENVNKEQNTRGQE
jgi:hypothetical protein